MTFRQLIDIKRFFYLTKAWFFHYSNAPLIQEIYGFKNFLLKIVFLRTTYNLEMAVEK